MKKIVLSVILIVSILSICFGVWVAWFTIYNIMYNDIKPHLVIAMGVGGLTVIIIYFHVLRICLKELKSIKK